MILSNAPNFNQTVKPDIQSFFNSNNEKDSMNKTLLTDILGKIFYKERLMSDDEIKNFLVEVGRAKITYYKEKIHLQPN